VPVVRRRIEGLYPGADVTSRRVGWERWVIGGGLRRPPRLHGPLSLSTRSSSPRRPSTQHGSRSFYPPRRVVKLAQRLRRRSLDYTAIRDHVVSVARTRRSLTLLCGAITRGSA
jgi:hypothetical protein